MREGVGTQTNNVAEYRALILGLKQAIKKGFKHIRVQGDSLLVCNQVCYLYKVCIFLNIFQIPPIFGSASLGLYFTKIAWMVIKKKTWSKCSQNITWWFEIYSLDSFYCYPSRWSDIVNLRYTNNHFSVFIQFFFLTSLPSYVITFATDSGSMENQKPEYGLLM